MGLLSNVLFEKNQTSKSQTYFFVCLKTDFFVNVIKTGNQILNGIISGGSDGTTRPHRHQHNNNNKAHPPDPDPGSGLGGETLTDWAQMHPLCQRNLTAYVGQTARMHCCLARLDRELNVRQSNEILVTNLILVTILVTNLTSVDILNFQ